MRKQQQKIWMILLVIAILYFYQRGGKPLDILPLGPEVYDMKLVFGSDPPIPPSGPISWEFHGATFTYLGSRSENDITQIKDILVDPLRFRDQIVWVGGTIVGKNTPGSNIGCKLVDSTNPSNILLIRDDLKQIVNTMDGHFFGFVQGKIWIEPSGGGPITYVPWIVPSSISDDMHPMIMDAPAIQDWKITAPSSWGPVPECLHLSVGGLPGPNGDRSTYVLSGPVATIGAGVPTLPRFGLYWGESNNKYPGIYLLAQVVSPTTQTTTIIGLSTTYTVVTTVGTLITLSTTSFGFMTTTSLFTGVNNWYEGKVFGLTLTQIALFLGGVAVLLVLLDDKLRRRFLGV